VVSPAASPGAGDDATPTEGMQAMTSGTGTVNFYMSDEKNAIDDFQSLNVTVEVVSFKRADAGDDDDDEDEESETEDDDAEMNEDDDTAEPTETPKVTDTATA
jgi:hypothetical protein